MEIHSLCPFLVGTLLWEAQPGQLSLSVVVKATFSLVPDGEAVPAPEQLAIAGDLYWDNDTQKALYSPSDSAPVKRRVDVILSGHAYAPGGAPVESLVAKLTVGGLVKAVRVTGDCLWTMPPGGAQDLVPGRSIPFVRMPLRYDRAARSADNPVGFDPHAPPAISQAASPNIEPLDAHAMPGFGPISPTWPSRRILLPDAALPWAYAVAEGAPSGPAPHSFNFEFFNAAPRDQQIDLLRAGTVIELEHLHPRIDHLRTTLPAIRPQVFRLAPGGKRAEEIVLRCDTLWIDSDRGVVVLSFRGLTDLGGMAEDSVGELFVAADPEGKKLRFDKVEQQLREQVGARRPTGPARDPALGEDDPLAIRHDAVKTAQPAQPAEPIQRVETDVERTRDVGQGSRRPTLPFAKGGADKAAGARKETTTEKGAAGKPIFKGDETADRTKDIGQLPRRPALPFAQRVTTPLKRPQAPGAPVGGAPATGTPVGGPSAAPGGPSAAPGGPSAAPGAASPSAAGAPRPVLRRPEPPKPAGALSRPATAPPPAAAPGEPDPDAITAEKEKKVPRAPLPPKPAMVATPTLAAPQTPTISAQGKGMKLGASSPAGPQAAPYPGPPKEAPPPPPEPEQLGYREKKPAPMPVAEPAAPVEPPPQDPEPASVSIEQYAAVSAELAQKGADRSAVLRNHKLSTGGWAAIDRHWTRAIAEQTERGERALLTSFDEAYVATQERLRRPVGVPEYARILVGLERGEVGRVLGDLELQLSDLMRLQRVWTKKITDTPKLAEELSQAVEAVRRG